MSSSNEQSASKRFKAAMVQMTSGRTPIENVEKASKLIRQAAGEGAHYIQTPEVTNVMELEREHLFKVCQPESDNDALKSFQALAKELGVVLHIGSMAVKAEDVPDRLANRSFVIDADGEITARYDKIHLFNVTLANGEEYAEGDNYRGGKKGVVVDLPWGRMGLTVCYDLRFPYLYRALAQGGARFIAIPAAFTHTTGTAHWHTLIRARAIETECFVFAACQTGRHEHGRRTFGHSLIVSPWGEILAEAGDEPGIISAEIDPAAVEEARSRVPSLEHTREFSMTDPFDVSA